MTIRKLSGMSLIVGAAALAAIVGCSGGGGGGGSAGTASIHGSLTRGSSVQTASAPVRRNLLARLRALVSPSLAVAEGTTSCGNPAVSADGVTVSLLLGGAVVQTTTTDAAGEFTFTGLAPGDYVIQVTLPSGTISAPALVQEGQQTALSGELEVDCEDVDGDNNTAEISLEVKEQSEDGSHLEGQHTEDGGEFEADVNDDGTIEHQSGQQGDRSDEQDSNEGPSDNSGSDGGVED